MPMWRTGALVCAFLVGLAPVAMRPAAAREPTPLEVFRDHYRSRDPRIRRKAVGQLADARGGDVVKALLSALRDDDAGVRGRAAKLLGEKRDHADEIAALVKVGLGRRPKEVRREAARALARAGRRAIEALRKALRDKQADVRRECALALGRLEDRESAPLLSERLVDPEALVRAAACESLGRLQGRDALGLAAAVLRGDRAPEPKIAAAEILGRHPGPGAVDHLAYGARDASWSVRVVASRALGRMGDDLEAARAAASVLVRALEREPRRRVRREFAEALRDLSGIDFGPAADRWTAWLREAGDTFVPPRDGRRARRPSKKGSTSEHLLDLPLESEHVCFVLDNSHSMDDPLRFGGKTTKRTALLAAFGRAVVRLPPDSYMNLIPFGTEPMPYKDDLFPATRQARRATVKYLAKRRPDGRTNLYDSLELALGDRQADTVVVVTDGAPSEGARKTRTAILAGVALLNRYRRARVHTVEVGSKNTSPRWRGFMRQLAEATGGRYLAR